MRLKLINFRQYQPSKQGADKLARIESTGFIYTRAATSKPPALNSSTSIGVLQQTSLCRGLVIASARFLLQSVNSLRLISLYLIAEMFAPKINIEESSDFN